MTCHGYCHVVVEVLVFLYEKKQAVVPGVGAQSHDLSTYRTETRASLGYLMRH